LREVVFNDGLKKIGVGAFERCSSLESITIPSSVTEIDKNAFDSCNGLNEVILNEGLKTIGWGAFAECESLHSITIPSSVTDIGVYAFKSCYNLSEVVCIEGYHSLNQLHLVTLIHCRESPSPIFHHV